jgi:hypothetical protein
MAEMGEIAAHTPLLVSHAAERATHAEEQRGAADDIDLAAAEARYMELTGERLYA